MRNSHRIRSQTREQRQEVQQWQNEEKISADEKTVVGRAATSKAVRRNGNLSGDMYRSDLPRIGWTVAGIHSGEYQRIQFCPLSVYFAQIYPPRFKRCACFQFVREYFGTGYASDNFSPQSRASSFGTFLSKRMSVHAPSNLQICDASETDPPYGNLRSSAEGTA